MYGTFIECKTEVKVSMAQRIPRSSCSSSVHRTRNGCWTMDTMDAHFPVDLILPGILHITIIFGGCQLGYKTWISIVLDETTDIYHLHSKTKRRTLLLMSKLKKMMGSTLIMLIIMISDYQPSVKIMRLVSSSLVTEKRAEQQTCSC